MTAVSVLGNWVSISIMDIVRHDLEKIDMYEEKGEPWPVYNGLEYLICHLKSAV